METMKMFFVGAQGRAHERMRTSGVGAVPVAGLATERTTSGVGAVS